MRISIYIHAKGNQHVMREGTLENLLHEHSVCGAVIRAATEGIVAVDAQGIIRMVNPAAAVMFGYEAAELIGKAIEILVPVELRALHKRHRSVFLDAVQTRPMGKGMELRGVRKDGEEFLVEISLTHFQSNGQPMVSAFITDITQRVQAERALEAEERFNVSVLNSLSSHICVIDQDGRITQTNDQWDRFADENMVGNPESVLAGANYLHTTEKASKNNVKFADEALTGIKDVVEGKLAEFVLEYPCHSPAEKRWFEMRVTPFVNGGPHVVIAHSNITARKKATLALAESTGYLNSVLQTITDFILQTDLNGTISFMNRTYPWHSREDVVGSNISSWILDDHKERFDAATRTVIESRKPGYVEVEVAVRKRDSKWFSLRIGPIVNNGKVTGLTYAATDMTEQLKVQKDISAQHHFIRKIMDASPNLIYIYDMELNQNVYYNKYFGEMLGYTEEDLRSFEGGILDEIIHPDDYIEKSEFIHRITEDPRSVYEQECRLKHKNGKWIWMLSRALIFSWDNDGNPSQIMGSMADIRRRKKLERELIEAVFHGQEKEKKRVAEDLHDGLAPLVSTVKINLEALENELYSTDDNVSSYLRNAKSLLDHALAEIRNISHNLMPAVLQEFGLVEALRDLCNKMNQSALVEVLFHNFGVDAIDSKSTELSLYRIAEELLNNSLKYSEAERIEVQLIRHSNSLVLTVEDNGVGTNEKKLKTGKKGIGLRNINSRIKALNGIMTIDTGVGKGFIACIEVPLEQSAQNEQSV